MDKPEREEIRYGVTPYGFRRKLYAEALAERMSRAKEVFGVNIDTSETSFLGKLIRNMAWDEAGLWERIEEVYFSAFVNSSEGTGLDNVGQYLTITRRPAVKSKGILTIKGVDGTKIPKGFRVTTKSGVIFETTDDAVITNGQVDVAIVSVAAGKSNNVAENAVTEIVNPSFGINSIVNVKATEGGLDTETDKEFRERYKKSYSRGGGSTVPALTAALLDIDSVVDAEVVENVTMETVNGIPPKSVACYVFGGSDEAVAEAIFQNKAAGIEAFGDHYVDQEDAKGRKHKIGFTRAKVEDVYVNLKLLKDENYNGDDAVKRAVLNYIGGIDEDGIEYAGLKLGNDVILSKVIGAVMCMGGVADVAVELSKDGRTYKDATVEIASNHIARTAPSKVMIRYV